MMDGIPQKTFVNEVWKYTIITVQVHVLTHFQYTMYYRYSVRFDFGIYMD